MFYMRSHVLDSMVYLSKGKKNTENKHRSFGLSQSLLVEI